MNIAGLFNVLASYYPLSKDFKNELEKGMIPLSRPKNHILLEAPTISNHAYYLEDGFAVSYSFHEGKKKTETFWKPGDIIVSFESFFEQVPSMETIQLLRKSDALCISHHRVMDLLEKFPEAQQICRAIIIRHYAHCRARLHDMQRLSAHQRFEKLLHAYPDLEITVSQDSIASYLGITAQSLSRMKRNED